MKKSIVIITLFLVSIIMQIFVFWKQENEVKAMNQSQAIEKVANLETRYSNLGNKQLSKNTESEIRSFIKEKIDEIKKLTKDYNKKLKEQKANANFDEIYREVNKKALIKYSMILGNFFRTDSGLKDYDDQVKKDSIQAKKQAIVRENGAVIVVKYDGEIEKLENYVKKFDENAQVIELLSTDFEQFEDETDDKNTDEEKEDEILDDEINENLYRITFSSGSLVSQELQIEIEKNRIPEKVLNLLVVNPSILRTQGNYTDGEDNTKLWNLTNIKADKYQEELSYKDKIIVGVIDTGIDYNHKDLRENMNKNDDEIAGNGIDDDNNGYIDDVYGYDFANNDSNPMDENGHGTHLAGIIGASVNSNGVYGVNSNASLMALKVTNTKGYGNDYDMAQAIKYAADNGAKVINFSITGIGENQNNIICKAIDYATSRGSIVVSSAGNEGKNAKYTVPAICNNVITVGTYDSTGLKASFSNYGENVKYAAPGVNIYSTIPGDQYSYMFGTSMSAAHVSGLISAMLAFNQNLTLEQIKYILSKNGDEIASRSDEKIGVAIDMEKVIKNIGEIPTSSKSSSSSSSKKSKSSSSKSSKSSSSSDSSKSSSSNNTSLTTGNSTIGLSCKKSGSNYLCTGTGKVIDYDGAQLGFFANGKLISTDDTQIRIKLDKSSTIKFTVTTEKGFWYSELKININ